ncbi:SpvB/TcaC N-terminal domain-containing protein [Roseovarius sp. S4756]|uniref:SpvB/TcaC N-terminal domain-containing protein n=1 Tax=Roseovarius maritimus TaxID=3342637 RepID=UPI00372A6169
MSATSQVSPSDVGISFQVSADQFTGAAASSVSFELPKGRNSLTPVLGLSYGSARRQGPFGRGWSLTGLPVIGVDAESGLPGYDGRDGYSSSLGGSLVPERDPVTHQPLFRIEDAHRIERFRAQQEGPRIRFERWIHQSTGSVHWRSRDTVDTLTIYGRAADGSSRISDPDAPLRIYQWLPELSVGARGDAIAYSYSAEDMAGGAGALMADQGQSGAQAQRYLRRIQWANLVPAGDPETFDAAAAAWAFHAVLDYGDHDAVDPALDPDGIWPARPDPFSVGTPGFSLRTWRLCRRLLVFHQFGALGAAPQLTQANVLSYDERAEGTLLSAITKTGYRRDGGLRQERSVPPLTFGYTQPELGVAFAPAQQALEASTPAGVSTPRTVLVDLYGEGLPGLLQDDPGGWFFQRNLGGGRFAAPVCVHARPAHSLTDVTLGDFDGDGNMDAVVMLGQGAGHYRFERETGEWSAFRPFDYIPTPGGTGFERLDLTGDGRADLLVREEGGLRIHEARGAAGYALEARHARLPAGSAAGPAGAPPLASDTATDYLFADMTGDGLPDQVLIRSGLVAYWPNLGRGRFGPPILMANAPVMGIGGRFAIDRVLLADLDGSGTADLIHLGAGEIHIWTNAAGNAFTEPRVLSGLPMIDSGSVLDILDIAGDGRMSLVWTEARQSRVAAYQTLALSGPVPPGLLSEVNNGMGRRDMLDYGHSASHFLRDQGTERAWTTHLPSHLITVDAVVTEDLIAGAKYETRYAYRNGAFNSRTRRFAGFGEVDATRADFLQDEDDPLPVSEPALIRSFLDQGMDAATQERFWNGDPGAVRVPPFALDRGAATPVPDPETWQDARDCLRGRMLRQEVYRVGANGPAAVPMTVSQSGYAVRIEQPAAPRQPGAERRSAGQRAVLACFEVEASTALHEGVADDPRVSHDFVLERDTHGAPTLAASLGYPRRAGIPVEDPAQSRMSCDLKRMVVRHDTGDSLLSLNTDIAQEEFSLPGLSLPARGYFLRAEIGAAAALGLAAPLRHDQSPVPARARRTSWSRQIYWNAAGDAALPVGEVAQPPRLHHIESAVFSEEFAVTHYGAASTARLEALGYWRETGHWWRASEVMTYRGADGYFLPTGHVLDDGTSVAVAYDAAMLFAIRVTDPTGAETLTEPDYQSLLPRQTVSATGAWSETQHDPLGVAVRAAHGGRVIDGTGAAQPYGFDALAQGAVPDLADAFGDPAAALGGAAQVLAYDLEAFAKGVGPLSEMQISAVDLIHDGEGGAHATGQIEIEITYRDGLGQPISSKRRVEGGLAIHRSGGGIVMDGGEPALQMASPRWRASGWIQRNRKGEEIRRFEPYFSDRPDYEDDAVLQTLGPAAQQFSDYAGRIVQILGPDGTMERAEYRAWSERHFDANDTVGQSAWRLSREILPANHPERRALDSSLPHADTPTERILDAAGRQVRLREADDQGGTREIRTIIEDGGGALRIIDARGIESSRHIHDMAGRRITAFHADAGEARTLYDPRDNPVEVTNANGLTRLTTFDAMDRAVSVDIDTGTGLRRIETVTYADDPADAAAVARNLLGLAIQRRDEAGLHSILGAAPNGQALQTAMRLVADAALPVDWSGAVTLEPQEFTAHVVHDAMGRPVRERRADGAIMRARYTEGGALSALFVTTEDGQVPETQLLGDATYSVTGQRESARLGNGVTIAREYQRETHLVRRITATRSAAGGRAPLLQDLRYTYDPVGNVTACTDLAHDPAGGAVSAFFSGTPGASAARFYTYDAHYRLIACEGRAHSALTGGPFHAAPVSLSDGSATERFTQSFSYDASDNLTRLRHVATLSNFTMDFWVDATSNRARPALDAGGLPVANPASDFGAGGEMRRLDHLAALEWRHDQRLSRAVVIDRSAQGLPDDDERYLYDSSGMRLRKITQRMLADTSVERTEVTYLAGAEIRRVFRGNTLILERFVTRFSDGLSEIAELHRWSRDDGGRETGDPTAHRLRYTIGDHLGSAMLRLDETARIISYEEFLPYGRRAFASGDDAREMALKAYGFIARERDAATGLHHIGQRYYASWLCRWISPDPAGDIDGPNLYRYAQSNPVTYYDPTGLQTTDTRERGTVRPVSIPDLPPEVYAAAAALSDEQRREYRALADANNFTYYIDGEGVVHFGTIADMRAMAEARLASGGDVQLATVASGQSDPDGTGTDGDEVVEEPEETSELPALAPSEEQGSPDSAGDTEGTGGSAAQEPTGGEGSDTADTDDGSGVGDERGREDGTGAVADSEEEGRGGGGLSEDPAATGRGDTGIGLGAGRGNRNDTGTGQTPSAGRPGGTGTHTGTGLRPGGRRGGSRDGAPGANGSNPNATGTLPDGVEGGTGDDPGGAPGGEEGGDARGTATGSLDGSLNGTLPDDGTGAPSGSGGSRSAPADAGRAPEGAGSSDEGTRHGSAQGSSQPGAGGDQQGSGGAQEPATVMDHVVRVAGYWNLEFSSSGTGGSRTGGVPGGMGSLDLGRWGQGLYVALTAVDIVLTVVTLGGLAAIKTGLKVGLRLMMSAGRRAIAAVGRAFSREALQNLTSAAIRRFGGRWYRTFYSVQGPDDVIRLLQRGGAPWPSGTRHGSLADIFGPGLYTFASREAAEQYLEALARKGVGNLRILGHSVSERALQGMKTADFRISDDIANAIYDLGTEHGMQRIIRQTGNFGVENFFSRETFSAFINGVLK